MSTTGIHVKRRRCSSKFEELEEPKSVLDIGGCISPPQQQQQLHLQHFRPSTIKKLKNSSSDEEIEENEDVWAPLNLAGDLDATLRPPSASFSCSDERAGSMAMDFAASWHPEILISGSDDDFDHMRLLESSSSITDHHWPSSHAASHNSTSASHDDKFLEIMYSADVFNPMQREDVLQHKIELKESVSSLVESDFWDDSNQILASQEQNHHRQEQQKQQQEHESIQPQIQQQEQQQESPAPVESPGTDATVGIRLIQLLLACAEAVACRDVNQAASLLGQLQLMASPQGDSMQRVTSCFVDGLTARLAGLQSLTLSGAAYKPAVAPPAARRILLPESLRDEGFRLVYEFCPYFSFGHFAANAAILEAFEGENRVHIVDLGMSNALQWPALLQGLASRPGGAPSSIRITGVNLEANEKLIQAGDELKQLALSLDLLGFEFRAVNHPVETLHHGMLDVREGEAMAINSAFQLHCVVKESRRSLKSVLQSIHELSPKILTLVEQDACHNGPFFLGRFMEALHYYSAIFDAVDSILPCDSQERFKIEQYHFAEEIKNIVACEGPDRVERHERADQWRRRMSRAGFQPKPLKFLGEVKTWLNMYFPSEGYTLVEEKGCIVLGWKGKPIVAASTWRC